MRKLWIVLALVTGLPVMADDYQDAASTAMGNAGYAIIGTPGTALLNMGGLAAIKRAKMSLSFGSSAVQDVEIQDNVAAIPVLGNGEVRETHGSLNFAIKSFGYSIRFMNMVEIVNVLPNGKPITPAIAAFYKPTNNTRITTLSISKGFGDAFSSRFAIGARIDFIRYFRTATDALLQGSDKNGNGIVEPAGADGILFDDPLTPGTNEAADNEVDVFDTKISQGFGFGISLGAIARPLEDTRVHDIVFGFVVEDLRTSFRFDENFFNVDTNTGNEILGPQTKRNIPVEVNVRAGLFYHYKPIGMVATLDYQFILNEVSAGLAYVHPRNFIVLRVGISSVALSSTLGRASKLRGHLFDLPIKRKNNVLTAGIGSTIKWFGLDTAAFLAGKDWGFLVTTNVAL